MESRTYRRLSLGLLAALAIAVPGAAAAKVSTVGTATKTVTITFWHAYSSDSPDVKTINTVLIPKFQKQHPNIKVKAVAVPYDSLHQKLLTATAGGERP